MARKTFNFTEQIKVCSNIIHREPIAREIAAVTMEYGKIIFFNIMVILNVHFSSECPHELADAKATYKSGEILDQSAPITLDKIKRKLKESGIFDPEDRTLNDRERKELSKLFDAVEIMTTSRNRQPFNVQNMFSSLRLVERAVKKQLKEGQISETLAAKFHWERLTARQKREKPMFTIDAIKKMRVFHLDP